MEPYRYLEKVAADLETLDTREAIDRVLDELEFLYQTAPQCSAYSREAA